MFVLLVFLGTTETFGQFGLQVGVNRVGFNDSASGVKIKGEKGLITFQVGVVYDMPFTDNLGLNLGALYYGKGSKKHSTFGANQTLDSKFSLGYVHVPVNFMYKTDMGLYFKGGPYIAYAFQGQEKHTEKTSKGEVTQEVDQKILFGSKEYETKAMDYGIGLGVGMKFGNIAVGLGYDLGLANLSNYNNLIMKNNAINLTAAYYFGE